MAFDDEGFDTVEDFEDDEALFEDDDIEYDDDEDYDEDEEDEDDIFFSRRRVGRTYYDDEELDD